MKLEHVLKKAAPFLLIVILISCLFSMMPQKEGMKSEKQHSQTDFPIAHSLKAPAKKLPQEYSSLWEKRRVKPVSDLITQF